MEQFMIEYFSYRTLLELSVRLRKNWVNFPTFWRLRAMAEEKMKEKLPSFKNLEKKIKKDPDSWDRQIGIFKGKFFAIHSPQRFHEEYEKQLGLLKSGEDVCDFMEYEAHKRTIRILEEQAFYDLNQFESPF
jgi:hypothetical protein